MSDMVHLHMGHMMMAIACFFWAYAIKMIIESIREGTWAYDNIRQLMTQSSSKAGFEVNQVTPTEAQPAQGH